MMAARERTCAFFIIIYRVRWLYVPCDGVCECVCVQKTLPMERAHNPSERDETQYDSAHHLSIDIDSRVEHVWTIDLTRMI